MAGPVPWGKVIARASDDVDVTRHRGYEASADITGPCRVRPFVGQQAHGSPSREAGPLFRNTSLHDENRDVGEEVEKQECFTPVGS